MGYALPGNSNYVSCSWRCHLDRNPPSGEAGTDYGVAYGSPVFAVEAGTVTYTRTTPTGATGRYVEYRLNDGRTTRTLHMSEVWVKPGDKVRRGQQIGKVGGSGFGNDWHYGPHIHQTLWDGAPWVKQTIDFAKYVGGPATTATQRVAGPNGANGRKTPSSKAEQVGMLAPGAVETMNGWITGETVSGNNVWFRSTKGVYYWSGGFTSTSKSGLPDLNTNPAERTTVAAGANVRAEAKANALLVETLAPNTKIVMDAYTHGQEVEGNKVWFRRKGKTGWAWSGGFTSKATTGLTFVDTAPKPPAAITRTVGVAQANVRPYPTTKVQAATAEEPGAVVVLDAYTKGEAVQGNDVWFRRKEDGGFMWSGGFTSQATTGLALITAPVPPTSNPDNPRGLPEYDAVYPRAKKGLKAPLGFNNDGTPALRTTKGTTPVEPIIDRFIIHHTATTVDQLDWFSYKNDRSVCPSLYLRPDGSTIELIRPLQKPAATGPDWNYRSIAVETLNTVGAPTWDVSALQVEELAQIAAWIAQHDGGTLDGVPVSFTLDRTHIISHQEALPGTECPGPFLQARLDAIVARARVIYAEANPAPQPDLVPVPRIELEKMRAQIDGWLSEE